MIIVVLITKHAKKQLIKRGITENEVIEAIKNHEVIFEEINSRFGIKKYSKIPLGLKSLIVVWFINKNDKEEVITAYWRRNKKWEK
ncbi:MAG: DUF4258 domain-containing protein [Candidatus Lokiarchaeota archaeon]|nr:DUF4258 domain-containing protein [Candidatus Lokiarchaeota archaeon]MBD3340869.1 DUF4258 domain-containing protein [Candidatus Lokiarchaeota archaeon]